MLNVVVQEPDRVRLEGRLDAAAVDQAEAALVSLSGEVRTDLSALDYISSAGISVLLRQFKRLRGEGGDLVLIVPAGHVLDVMRYAGLDRVFTLETPS